MREKLQARTKKITFFCEKSVFIQRPALLLLTVVTASPLNPFLNSLAAYLTNAINPSLD